MKPTPETDAEERYFNTCSLQRTPELKNAYAFARKLERERDEAHAEKKLILSKLRGISFGLSTHPSDTPLNGCLISEASKEKLKSLDELIEYHEPKS